MTNCLTPLMVKRMEGMGKSRLARSPVSLSNAFKQSFGTSFGTSFGKSNSQSFSTSIGKSNDTSIDKSKQSFGKSNQSFGKLNKHSTNHLFNQTVDYFLLFSNNNSIYSTLQSNIRLSHLLGHISANLKPRSS